MVAAIEALNGHIEGELATSAFRRSKADFRE